MAEIPSEYKCVQLQKLRLVRDSIRLLGQRIAMNVGALPEV